MEGRGGGHGALLLVAVGVFVFLISYTLLVMVLRCDRGGGGAGVSAIWRDPVVVMSWWMRMAGGTRWQRQPFYVASAYSRWQCQVMYYWYKRIQTLREGAEMDGFTRVLHSGKPNDLMDEIPTFFIDPLPSGTRHGPRTDAMQVDCTCYGLSMLTSMARRVLFSTGPVSYIAVTVIGVMEKRGRRGRHCF